jgi:RHS repeat-associated protein
MGLTARSWAPILLSVTSTQFTVTASSLSVYFAGKRVAIIAGGVNTPFMQDRLGSNMSGAQHPVSLYPWGEDRGTPAPNDQIKFATYTRDSSTLLDYADQRYYSNQFGRFATPDPYMSNTGGAGDPSDPESWNRYTYTRGDPVNRQDQWGMQDSGCPPDGGVCIWFNSPPGQSGGLGDQTYGGSPGVGGNGGPVKPFNDPVGQKVVFSISVAVRIAREAATILATKTVWPPQCVKDLADVKMTPLQLEQAALMVQFEDGFGSSVLVSSLYPSPASNSINPTLTVGQDFQNHPNQHAESSLVSDTIFLNPTYFSSIDIGLAVGTIMHELLHTGTAMDDTTLASDLDISLAGIGSYAITIKLLGDCFPGSLF